MPELWSLASNAVPQLINSLSDTNEEVRRSAVTAFLAIPAGPDEAVPALVTYLDGPHPDTNWEEFEKVAALAALDQYARDSSAALAALRRMTNAETSLVRFKAELYLRSVEQPSRERQPGDPLDLYRSKDKHSLSLPNHRIHATPGCALLLAATHLAGAPGPRR